MSITKNKVVQFHYTLFDANSNQEIETSRDADPVLYLHGHKNVIQGLEEAMEGKSQGDSFSVTAAPEKAYGPRDESRQQRVPVKHLHVAKKAKLIPGLLVHVQTERGAIPATIIKAGKFTVDVDLNHPFAGKDLRFEVDVVDVRDASDDEIAHGHAHGVGGHQHD
jgi:FKBP-type peptidyl-prolyl cis-trans isomerase SlyD